MSSILSSQGVVLATAMAVSAGTVILLALRLQKSLPIPVQTQILRSCITTEGNKKDKKKKKNKRVHFAEDVVDPSGDGEAFRRQHCLISNSSNSSSYYSSSSSSNSKKTSKTTSSMNKLKKIKEMPANRVALYNGMLRDRLVHRSLAYSC